MLDLFTEKVFSAYYKYNSFSFKIDCNTNIKLKTSSKIKYSEQKCKKNQEFIVCVCV